MKTIGNKIKELRQKSNVRQEELAYQLGVSRQTVSKWEADDVQPSTDSIMGICDYFHVPADYLLGNGEMEPRVAATEVTENDAKVDNAANKNKTKKILCLGLSVLFLLLFLLGVFIICMTIFEASQPQMGYGETSARLFDDAVIIIGAALAVVSLALFIFFAALLFKNTKDK